MPDIDEVLKTHILKQTDFTALIGRRFYFDELPKDTKYPAVVCIEISDVANHSHDGESDHAQPVKQFSVYADTKKQAENVARKLKSILSDYCGDMEGLFIQYITKLNEISGKWNVSSDGLLQKHTVDIEYQIDYTRSE